jgi:hypothetical protein
VGPTGCRLTAIWAWHVSSVANGTSTGDPGPCLGWRGPARTLRVLSCDPIEFLYPTPLNARLLSLRHSSLGWRASPLTRSGQIVSQGCLVHDQQKERIPGQRHDLNKCTLQDPYVWMFPKPLTNRYTNL